jgi:hypothetical protein
VSDQVLDVQEPGSPTAKIDGEELVVGVNTVVRERTQVAGASPLEISRVTNSEPAGTEYALVTRPIPSGVQEVVVKSQDGSETTAIRRLLEEILVELKTMNERWEGGSEQ